MGRVRVRVRYQTQAGSGKACLVGDSAEFLAYSLFRKQAGGGVGTGRGWGMCQF